MPVSVLYIRDKDGKFIPVPAIAAGQNVDDALSTTSTNPVQNKVVKAEFDRLSEEIAKVYNATYYGVSTDAESNTEAMQDLMQQVHNAGGGTIFIPIGIYNFKSSIIALSNVSIIGENMEKTVLKMTKEEPYPLFHKMGTKDSPITGCTYSNFTVDAYATGDVNQVSGKAFYYQYVRDCVFRDLILKGTIATALGIDYLDRVVIDGVHCIDCGRTYSNGAIGTSGIGIGTGGWDNENFVITNCTCVGSGQYGIFIENQYNIFGHGHHAYAKGCIIANCVVHNGLNKGIGIRGGENVTVANCETYENASHGVYVDNKCKNVHVIGCSSTANLGDGVCLEPDAESARVVIKNCIFADNSGNGIAVNTPSHNLCIADNHVDGNGFGLFIGSVELDNCVLNNNTVLDATHVLASFTGNTKYIKYDADSDALYPFANGTKELTDGSITVQNGNHFALTKAEEVDGYYNLSSCTKMSGSVYNTSHLASADTVFSLKVGDVVTFSGNGTASRYSDEGFNSFVIALKGSDGATVAKTKNIATDGNAWAVNEQYTVSADANISSVFAMLLRNVSGVEGTVSIFVNGERYV